VGTAPADLAAIYQHPAARRVHEPQPMLEKRLSLRHLPARSPRHRHTPTSPTPTTNVHEEVPTMMTLRSISQTWRQRAEVVLPAFGTSYPKGNDHLGGGLV
jgi:hypothetical protein